MLKPGPDTDRHTSINYYEARPAKIKKIKKEMTPEAQPGLTSQIFGTNQGAQKNQAAQTREQRRETAEVCVCGER